MMRPNASVEKVYLYPKPVDFRKSIDGLAALVELDIKVAVFDPVLFVFLNRHRNRVKVLYWERNGFCLWLKRLESERFKTSPYAIHKPHLPYGRGMKSGIRVGSILHLSSYPKQSVGYLSTALQPFSRQPNRFVLVHRIADETMFMQSAHGLEVEPFPSIAVIKTEGYQQGKHGFFNQFIVVFHDRCSARSLNSP